jgi:uncharacterized Zn-binding protein involved in type VI secretion
MRNCARLTDIFYGKCISHSPVRNKVTGIIISGSANVTTNQLCTARLTDVVLSTCKHIGVIVTASSSISINNLGMARIGDTVYGQLRGTIITGSSNMLGT